MGEKIKKHKHEDEATEICIRVFKNESKIGGYINNLIIESSKKFRKPFKSFLPKTNNKIKIGQFCGTSSLKVLIVVLLSILIVLVAFTFVLFKKIQTKSK